MVQQAFEEKIEQAVWIAHSLFERGKTSGSSANLSFLHNDEIWITQTGCSFGILDSGQFACVDKNGDVKGDKKPSKEIGLHRQLYIKKPEIQAVIHTHGPYSTLWSCLEHENKDDVIPQYTPYLKMKIGNVVLVGYAHPGSQALFTLFEYSINTANAYLLANHGPIVAAANLMEAFGALEELEDSARLAWMLKDERRALTIKP